MTRRRGPRWPAHGNPSAWHGADPSGPNAGTVTTGVCPFQLLVGPPPRVQQIPQRYYAIGLADDLRRCAEIPYQWNLEKPEPVVLTIFAPLIPHPYRRGRTSKSSGALQC